MNASNEGAAAGRAGIRDSVAAGVRPYQVMIGEGTHSTESAPAHVRARQR